MATVIPKKGQIVLTKEAFDAKAAAGELIPGAEYLINNIQYATTEELNNTATSLNTEITNTGNRVTEVERQISSIPEWAKQEHKPTYTAEEVGALPNTTQYDSSVNGQSGAITDIATQTEVDKKVDKTSVSESVVANSVVKRTVDGDILVNDDNTAMASKPSNIAVSKGYVQYIMTTLSELFGQNLEAVISSISSSASTDGYTQTLTFKNVNDIGIGTLDIVMPKTNLEITEDSSLFKYTFTLKDSKGNTLSTKTIDLPLEELVVNGSYNNVTKSIVLTLKNGNTVDIPVGDLVEGLVNSTDLQNALSTKVDKVSGKGLSTNDYTNTDKSKLDGLANIKTIGDNLTLDGQGKLSAKTASGVSSINGQTGAVTGIATTEEVNNVATSLNTNVSELQGQINNKADKFEVVYDKNNPNIAYDFPNGITSGQTLAAQGICTQIRDMDIVFVETNLGKAILHLQDMNYGVNYAGASFTMTNGGNAAITAQLYIWLFGLNEVRYIKETAYDIHQDYTIVPIDLPITIYKIFGGKLL